MSNVAGSSSGGEYRETPPGQNPRKIIDFSQNQSELIETGKRRKKQTHFMDSSNPLAYSTGKPMTNKQQNFREERKSYDGQQQMGGLQRVPTAPGRQGRLDSATNRKSSNYIFTMKPQQQQQLGRKSQSTGRPINRSKRGALNPKEIGSNVFQNMASTSQNSAVRYGSSTKLQQQQVQELGFTNKEQLYKAYMSYVPNTSEPQNDTSMVNRHNNLIQKNRNQLNQHVIEQHSSQQSQKQQLPNIVGGQSFHSNKDSLQLQNQPTQDQSQQLIHSQQTNFISSTAQKPKQNAKINPQLSQANVQGVNKQNMIMMNSTTVVPQQNAMIYNSLENYQNKQQHFASINNSIIARQMKDNFSLILGELEVETRAMEDMHLYFVAFNKRQKKIVEGIEQLPIQEEEESKQTQGDSKQSELNVEILEQEEDLE